MTDTLTRPDIDYATLPPRMRTLPLDARGYPVPWFVDWIDGVPDHRVVDQRKFKRAVVERRCWTCGEVMGKWLMFVIGPMCGINRTTSEPASHRDCAIWAVRNCPFLSRPHMVRRDGNLPPDAEEPGGQPLLRNPGVVMLWTTATFRIFRDAQQKPLIQIGDPHEVAWYREGRAATRAEVEASVESGLPLLRATLDRETASERPRAERELERRRLMLQMLYPT